MRNNKKNTIDYILTRAEKERIKLKHPYVGSEHLFLSLLSCENELSSYLETYCVTYDLFMNELISVVGNCKKGNPDNLYTPLLRKIIKRYENKKSENLDIYTSLFMSILDEGEGIAIRILLKMNIDLDEIYIDLKEKEKIKQMQISNQIGTFLNKTVNLDEEVYARDEEINKIILSLSRKKKCNPILIGPAGVGKSAIVEELVRRIIKKKVPKFLENTKIIMIEMGALISGTKYRGEFEERLNNLIKEVINDKNTIIFIDEIHTMIGAGGAEGAINASDILKPYLARGEIKCIGATTTSEYNNTILKDKALARRFDVINVVEPSEEQMYKLLTSIKKEYESFHNIVIPNNVLKKIVELSDRYMKSISNPDKSIDLLDSSCAHAKINNSDNILTVDDVLETVFYKTNNVLIKDKDFISKLVNKLDDYISEGKKSEIINKFNLYDNRPISIITNKKEVEKIFKSSFNNINYINIDLNGYYINMHKSLYENQTLQNCIFSSLINKPFSLICINGIETADKMIIEEMSRINNEGFITLKDGEKIYFNNAIIVTMINDSKTFKTGFNKSIKKIEFSDEFINSFKLDLRSEETKEIYV